MRSTDLRGVRAAVAVLVVTALVRPVGAQAQRANGGQTADVSSAKVVLFTASGGISKGSYQGGVDWTITEFLRRSRDPEFLAKLQLGHARFVLGAATGASAGNIDALFSAIHYCTERSAGEQGEGRPIPAEKSLFWKAWISTGTRELLPDGPRRSTSERAALDRAFFQEEYLPAIQKELDTAVPVEGCDVPVGLTLTRVIPVQIRLTKSAQATASVQRFAVVFRVATARSLTGVTPGQTTTTRVSRLQLEPASDALKDSSLGALVALPTYEGLLGTKDVFNATMASSSFPVAFAPRKVNYVHAGLGASDEQPEEALFTDGGVFDNNPMSLAAGLNRHTGTASDLVYSSPMNYRQPMLDARLPCSPLASEGARAKAREAGYCKEPQPSGLTAARVLLVGAYESARQYELQSFARQLGNIDPRPTLRMSSRAHAIVGESLRSFGAFLGRPFREHDFYAGVYDGLRFIAESYLCENAMDTPCIEERMDDLVDLNRFELSPVGRATVTHLFATETARESGVESARAAKTRNWASRDAESATKEERDRWTLLRSVLEAMPLAEATAAVENAECGKVLGLIHRQMCPGGLSALVAKLRGNADVASALVAMKAACGSRRDCDYDPQFEQLLKRQTVHLYKLEKKAMTNLERAEDAAQDDHLGDYTGMTEWAFSVYRTLTYRYRNGVVGPLEFVMSSARAGDTSRKLPLALGFLAPSYIQKSNGDVGFGWRPVTWVWSQHAHVNGTVEISKSVVSRRSFRGATSYGVGLGTFTSKLPAVTAAEAGVFFPSEAQWEAMSGNPETTGWKRASARISLRLLYDKVQLTYSHGRGARSFGVALNDVNGLLYWWAR